MMKKFIELVRKETVLVIAWVLAIISAFFVKPNIKYKITNKEKLNSSDLEELNNCLTEQLDFEKNSVSSAYYVTFTCYVSGSDHVYTADRYLIKIKGKWYMGRGFTI